jgi:DNA polymerase-1
MNSEPASVRQNLDLIFDIETDGFAATKIHCLICIVVQTGEIFRFADQPGYPSIAEGVALLASAEKLIGHGILNFDCPKLRKLAGARFDREKLKDTLTTTRILWPDLREADAAAAVLPANLWGKHSLEAWGWRLGCHKGTFSDWGRFSTKMVEYCVQDCVTSWMLYEHIRDTQAAQ